VDRRARNERESFSSKILPPYLRKTKSLEELIPWLYLKGISTGDFSDALASLVGPSAKGLSPATVTRLKQIWEGEFQEWNDRSLAGKQYAYLWADGVHFNIRLEEDRQCILVLMGATADGKKELIAIQDGYRESEQSWKQLLLDVKARGLLVAIPSWPLATAPWAFGRRLSRCTQPLASNAVGCTRRPMCSTSCPSGCSHKPRIRSIRSGWPRSGKTPKRLSIHNF
jgi:Transposase, Mutator family